MESLATWLANNASRVWAFIIGFISLYGASIVLLVIALVKAKLKAITEANAMTEKEKKLVDNFMNALDEFKTAIIENSNANTQKRIEAMKEIADLANAENEKLKEAQEVNSNTNTETTETTLDALNGLE